MCRFYVLTAFIWRNVLEIHWCCCQCLGFVPIYCWVVPTCADIPPFVYLFIGWWTCGLFPNLGHMSEAAMSVLIQLFCVGLCFLFLFSKYLGVELLGPMLTACLLFWELPKCFPQWLYHLIFTPTMYISSDRFISLPVYSINNLLKFYHSSRCAMVSYCGFNLRAVFASDVGHLSMCLCALCISSLVIAYSSIWAFFIGLSPFYQSVKILYSRYKTFARYMYYKYFQLYGLSFP